MVTARAAPNVSPEEISRRPPGRAWIAWIPSIPDIREYAPTRELAMERLMRRWGPRFRAGIHVSWNFHAFGELSTVAKEIDDGTAAGNEAPEVREDRPEKS